jgi:transposase
VLEPDDHHLGRSRGGWGSKLHLVTDGNGLVLAAAVTAGQAHESTQLHRVMHAVRRPRHVGWPLKLAGDKGYSYDSARAFLAACGIEPVIPRRENQPRPEGERFDRDAYRKRGRVEQAVGWLKECRRLGTRYEKLGLNFLAFVNLGIMLKYLRLLDPSDTA